MIYDKQQLHPGIKYSYTGGFLYLTNDDIKRIHKNGRLDPEDAHKINEAYGIKEFGTKSEMYEYINKLPNVRGFSENDVIEIYRRIPAEWLNRALVKELLEMGIVCEETDKLMFNTAELEPFYKVKNYKFKSSAASSYYKFDFREVLYLQDKILMNGKYLKKLCLKWIAKGYDNTYNLLVDGYNNSRLPLIDTRDDEFDDFVRLIMKSNKSHCDETYEFFCKSSRLYSEGGDLAHDWKNDMEFAALAYDNGVKLSTIFRFDNSYPKRKVSFYDSKEFKNLILRNIFKNIEIPNDKKKIGDICETHKLLYDMMFDFLMGPDKVRACDLIWCMPEKWIINSPHLKMRIAECAKLYNIASLPKSLFKDKEFALDIIKMNNGRTPQVSEFVNCMCKCNSPLMEDKDIIIAYLLGNAQIGVPDSLTDDDDVAYAVAYSGSYNFCRIAARFRDNIELARIYLSHCNNFSALSPRLQKSVELYKLSLKYEQKKEQQHKALYGATQFNRGIETQYRPVAKYLKTKTDVIQGLKMNYFGIADINPKFRKDPDVLRTAALYNNDSRIKSQFKQNELDNMKIARAYYERFNCDSKAFSGTYGTNQMINDYHDWTYQFRKDSIANFPGGSWTIITNTPFNGSAITKDANEMLKLIKMCPYLIGQLDKSLQSDKKFVKRLLKSVKWLEPGWRIHTIINGSDGKLKQLSKTICELLGPDAIK